jgi:polyhydroxybutyrate depolymerase
VLLLHGRGGSARRIEQVSGMSGKADGDGFIVAYPQALGVPSTWHPWPLPGRRAEDAAGDVAFIRALIEQLKHTLVVDVRRIYVAGHSSGAMMAYRVGAELGDRVAAIGVVAGTIGWTDGDSTSAVIPAPARPVSVVVFHGRADPVVPYDDTLPHPPGYPRPLPVARSVAFWVLHDGCAPEPERVSMAGGSVLREHYTGGRSGTEVTAYTIVRGDHRWPAGDVSATDLMWAFFATHPKR